MWVECSRRQPAEGGEYRVIRRAMGSKPHYYDWCRWTPPINAGKGYWSNRRGTVITTVEWWEEPTETPETDERAETEKSES